MSTRIRSTRWLLLVATSWLSSCGEGGQPVGHGGTTAVPVDAPTFSPVGGRFERAPLVTLATGTPGASIRFTLDGQPPTPASPIYTAPIALSDSTTIIAVAERDGVLSDLARATYVVDEVFALPFRQPGCHASGVGFDAVLDVPITIRRPSAKVCPLASGERTCSADELCVTELGALLEPTRTQLYPTPTDPAPGVVHLSGTGPHQFWVMGAGAQTLTASGSLVAVGLPCTATASAPCTFSVTALGSTPTASLAPVTGDLSRAQVEQGGYRTSFIPAGTRVGDMVQPTRGDWGLNGIASDWCVRADVSPLGDWDQVGTIFRVGNANPSAQLTIEAGALTLIVADPKGKGSNAKLVLDGLLPTKGPHTVAACLSVDGRAGILVDGVYPTQSLGSAGGDGVMGPLPAALYVGSGPSAAMSVGAFVKNVRVSRRSPLPPVAPKRALWLADSIYRNSALWTYTGIYASKATVSPLTSDVGAYSGNVAGVALVELADATYAYEAGKWTLRARGVPFSKYDALLFEFGANDSGGPPDTFRRTYDKILDQARRIGFPKVCAGTPPPHSTDMLTWSAAPLEFGGTIGGHYAVVTALWTKWGASRVDTVARFEALTAAGSYTVAQLSSDGTHPALPTGYARIAEQLGECLVGGHAPFEATPEIVGRTVNELFGQPVSGVWALTPVTPGMSSPGQLNRIAGYDGERVLQAAQTGAKVRFNPWEARAIWLRYYVDATAGGTFRWYIDRGTPGEMTGLIGTNYYSMHPVSTLLAENLPAGSHLVELETTNSAPVRIQGVTYVGVP